MEHGLTGDPEEGEPDSWDPTLHILGAHWISCVKTVSTHANQLYVFNANISIRHIIPK